MAIALGKFAERQQTFSGKTLSEVILVEKDRERAELMYDEYRKQFAN